MAYLTEKIIELRFTSIKIINRLMEDGQVNNRKDGLKYLIENAKDKKVKTGFSDNLQRAYHQLNNTLKRYKSYIAQ